MKKLEGNSKKTRCFELIFGVRNAPIILVHFPKMSSSSASQPSTINGLVCIPTPQEELVQKSLFLSISPSVLPPGYATGWAEKLQEVLAFLPLQVIDIYFYQSRATWLRG